MTLRIQIPGSKSMTQRAFVLGALSNQTSVIRGALDCGDSRDLARVLGSLGTRFDWDVDAVRITPGRITTLSNPLDCGQGASTLRFVAGLTILCDQAITLTAHEQLAQRPIGPLLDALETLGVQVVPQGRPGQVPVALTGPAKPTSNIALDLSVSSQFASAILMPAPRLGWPLGFTWGADIVSRPYVEMTLAMMQSAGARLVRNGPTEVTVLPSTYDLGNCAIEPDWSTAAMVLTASRIRGVETTIQGLPDTSLQGDSAFPVLAEEVLANGAQAINLRDTPDLFPPLMALACTLATETVFTEIQHIRRKESDRIRVMSQAAEKLGCEVTEGPDHLRVVRRPHELLTELFLDPHDDHRMAMAFGLLSLRHPGIHVLNPGCVAKSFPGFWDLLTRVRGA